MSSGASEVSELLQQSPDARVKVLVLWTPVLKQRQPLRCSESDHLPERPESRAFLGSLDLRHEPLHEETGLSRRRAAWDIFVLYQPGTEWILPGPDPSPDYWAQHCELDFGPDYTQAELKD